MTVERAIDLLNKHLKSVDYAVHGIPLEFNYNSEDTHMLGCDILMKATISISIHELVQEDIEDVFRHRVKDGLISIKLKCEKAISHITEKENQHEH